MAVEPDVPRQEPLEPVIRSVGLSEARRHDGIGLRSLWRVRWSSTFAAQESGSVRRHFVFPPSGAVWFDPSSPVITRSHGSSFQRRAGPRGPWFIGESWPRLGWRLRSLAATGRSQRFSPDLRSFLAQQNRRVSRSSAGAAVAGDAAVRFAACWFTDKAAMGATL